MSQLENYVIKENPHNFYTFHEKLGSGQFATAYRAVSKSEPPVTVAIKKMPIKSRSCIKNIQYAVNELEIGRAILGRKINSEGSEISGVPGIPEYYDAFLYDGAVWMVIQYIDGKSLSEVHENLPYLPLAIAILSIIRELEANDVCHDDISMSNFMITSNSGKVGVYLLDFGLSVTQISSWPEESHDSDFRYATTCDDRVRFYQMMRSILNDRPTTERKKLNQVKTVIHDYSKNIQSADQTLAMLRRLQSSEFTKSSYAQERDNPASYISPEFRATGKFYATKRQELLDLKEKIMDNDFVDMDIEQRNSESENVDDDVEFFVDALEEDSTSSFTH